MPNVTVKQVREALKANLLKITTANGYANTIAATHIYPVFDAVVQSRQQDTLYPKFFILTESGSNAKQPSGRTLSKIVFLFVAVVKKGATDSPAPQEMIESYINDVERCMLANDTLDGVVQDIVFSEYSTDSGNLHPEGAAVMRLECEYFKQF